MINFYFKPTLIFFCACLTLSITARTFGEAQPPNPALIGFTQSCADKPQSCWFGIVPGETKLDAAQQTIREMGYIHDGTGYCNDFDSEVYRLASSPVEYINLCASGGIVRSLRLAPTGRLDINLGDLLLTWNEPDFIEFTSRVTGSTRTSLRLHYPRAVIFVSLVTEQRLPRSIAWLDEHSSIRSIDLLSVQPLTGAMRPRVFTRWSGLMPLWFYCRRNSEFAPCYLWD